MDETLVCKVKKPYERIHIFYFFAHFQEKVIKNLLIDILLLKNNPKTSIPSPNHPTITTLIQRNPATVSSQRKKISHICGLRARIECEPLGEHSTHSDRVTNMGYLFSLGASSVCFRKLNSNPLPYYWN